MKTISIPQFSRTPLGKKVKAKLFSNSQYSSCPALLSLSNIRSNSNKSCYTHARVIKGIFKDKLFLTIIAYITLLIVVDNLLLQGMRSPQALVQWLDVVYKDSSTITLSAQDMQSTSVIPGFPTWTDSLIWVVITIAVYIFKKRFLLWPLIIYNAWLTFWLIIGVIILSVNLWNPNAGGADVLLTDAFFIWASNVVIFTVWYWILDHRNQLKFKENKETKVHFLFSPTIEKSPGWKSWTPGFVDYLFFSFNTSTAWGSSDTVILTQRAKLFIILESFISMVLFVIIAARAINLI